MSVAVSRDTSDHRTRAKTQLGQARCTFTELIVTARTTRANGNSTCKYVRKSDAKTSPYHREPRRPTAARCAQVRPPSRSFGHLRAACDFRATLNGERDWSRARSPRGTFELPKAAIISEQVCISWDTRGEQICEIFSREESREHRQLRKINRFAQT